MHFYNNNQGKEQRPPLHLGIVAIEKGAFGSRSITVAKFSLLHNNNHF